MTRKTKEIAEASLSIDDSIRELIKEYITENLSISINTTVEFGPVDCIEVDVYLGNEKITSSSTSLPSRN